MNEEFVAQSCGAQMENQVLVEADALEHSERAADAKASQESEHVKS